MESSTHTPNLDLGNSLRGPEAASPGQAPSSLPHGGSCRRSSHPSHQLTKREKRVRNRFITSFNATSKSTSKCGPVYILVSQHSYFLLPLQCKGSAGDWGVLGIGESGWASYMCQKQECGGRGQELPTTVHLLWLN